MSLRPLRPHQDAALGALRASLREGRLRPMLQAPTGFGKTLLAAHIINRARDRGKRVGFLVPRLTLIEQTVSAFEAEGIEDIGVVQGSHLLTDPRQPVQICSAQTLARRSKPAVDFVLVDEAHEMHRSILDWMTDPEWAHVPFIGLSATPWSRGLGKYYTGPIIAATTGDLIDKGFLSPFQVFAPATPDLSGVATVAGDYAQDQLADVMNTTQITGDIVSTWIQRGEDRPTLAFCVNRAHARHVSECFEAAGVNAEYMDGETSRDDRELTFRRFRQGRTRVICNVGVLTTGVDLDVRCIIDAKPTKSPILFVQTIGRGLRTAEGKTDCRILDHAGNTLSLGLVTDIHRDGLDMGTATTAARKAREKKEPRLRLCRACKAVLPALERVCSACADPGWAVSTVHVVEGDLVVHGSKGPPKAPPSYLDRLNFYRELLSLKKPEWRDGWVAAKYKDRFRAWPPREWATAVPLPVSPATFSWHRASMIRWAKRTSAGSVSGV